MKTIEGEDVNAILISDMTAEELSLALDFAEKVWGLSREKAIEELKKGNFVFRLE